MVNKLAVKAIVLGVFMAFFIHGLLLMIRQYKLLDLESGYVLYGIIFSIIAFASAVYYRAYSTHPQFKLQKQIQKKDKKKFSQPKPIYTKQSNPKQTKPKPAKPEVKPEPEIKITDEDND